MWIVSPETKPARGSHITVSTTSSASPWRPAKVPSALLPDKAVFSSPRRSHAPESTTPGETALTRTGAGSAARWHAAYSTAPFVAPLTSGPGPGFQSTTPLACSDHTGANRTDYV